MSYTNKVSVNSDSSNCTTVITIDTFSNNRVMVFIKTKDFVAQLQRFSRSNRNGPRGKPCLFRCRLDVWKRICWVNYNVKKQKQNCNWSVRVLVVLVVCVESNATKRERAGTAAQNATTRSRVVTIKILYGRPPTDGRPSHGPVSMKIIKSPSDGPSPVLRRTLTCFRS